MTVEEILRAASDASPEKLEKVASALFYLENVEPSFANELKSEIREIAGYSLEKSAGVAGGLNVPQSIAIGAATMAGAGLLAATATDLYDAAKRGLTRGRNFNRIMEANPEFKSDKKLALQAFNAIHRYAPELTADPLVGGSLMTAIMQMPGAAYTVIKDVAGIRTNIQTAKHKQVNFMGPSFEEYPGGPKARTGKGP